MAIFSDSLDRYTIKSTSDVTEAGWEMIVNVYGPVSDFKMFVFIRSGDFILFILFIL